LAVRSVLKDQLTTVELGNATGNGQAEPGPRPEALVQSPESPQGLVPLVSRYAGPLVTYPYAEAAAIGRKVCVYPGIFGAVLYGVGQQGPHQCVEQGRLATDHGLADRVFQGRFDALT
jgi:hypothetical protein